MREESRGWRSLKELEQPSLITGCRRNLLVPRFFMSGAIATTAGGKIDTIAPELAP
jgi:hypothetical protein